LHERHTVIAGCVWRWFGGAILAAQHCAGKEHILMIFRDANSKTLELQEAEYSIFTILG
jgi:hypothetical protein